MKKRMIVSILASMLYAGTSVAGPVDSFVAHPEIAEAAKAMAEEYLEGQKNGESPTKVRRFGERVPTFHSLHEYECQRYEDVEIKDFRNWGGYPTIHCNAKISAGIGNPRWKEVYIVFDRDPAEGGNKYSGLRIKEVVIP